MEWNAYSEEMATDGILRTSPDKEAKLYIHYIAILKAFEMQKQPTSAHFETLLAIYFINTSKNRKNRHTSTV